MQVHSKEIERLSKKDGKKSSQKAQDAIHEFTIEHAEGGHIITHRGKDYDSKPEKHVVKSHAGIKKHLDEHCTGCSAAPEEDAEMD